MDLNDEKTKAINALKSVFDLTPVKDERERRTIKAMMGYLSAGAPNMLPIVKNEGEFWFFDERLSELRSIYNPSISQRVGELEREGIKIMMEKDAPVMVYNIDFKPDEQ